MGSLFVYLFLDQATWIALYLIENSNSKNPSTLIHPEERDMANPLWKDLGDRL